MTTRKEDVQLLTTVTSPWGMIPQLALCAKGIPFTVLIEDIKHKSALLLQSNPVLQQVPVLLHLGLPVCESFVIAEYVDEAFPSPHGNDLLPKDPYHRAVARFWADFCHKKVLISLFKAFHTAGEAHKAAVDETKEHFKTLEGALITIGKEPPYFGGVNVGFVDIILGPVVVWLPVLETLLNFDLELEKLPRMSAWMKAFRDSKLPGCLPAREKLMEAARIVRKRYVPNE